MQSFAGCLSSKPISIINLKKAIILIYLNKAEIIEHDDKYIHSVNDKFLVPSILRLVQYIKTPKKNVILSRRNILKRDNRQCQYCGNDVDLLTIDHVIPRAHGGEDSWENLVCACLNCNNKKGDRTPVEAEMMLSKQPRKPDYLFFIQCSVRIIDNRWKPYLYMKE